MKKVTLKDIAEHTGFSVSKVSRALNETGAINPEDKRAILEVAAELGYISKKGASELFIRQKQERVAVLIQKFDSYSVSFFLQRLNNYLLDNDFLVDFYTVEGSRLAEADLIQYILEKNYKILIYKPLKVYDEVQAVINSSSIPIVSFGQVYGNCININYDNKRVMIDVTNMIADQQCHNVLYIGTFKNDIEVGARRFEGFLEVATMRDLSYQYLECKCEIEASYQLSKQIDLKEYDAVICATDNLALGFHKRMLEMGIVPGKDILLTGVGNNKISKAVTPELTTVELDKEYVADLITNILLEERFRNKNYFAPHALLKRATA